MGIGNINKHSASQQPQVAESNDKGANSAGVSGQKVAGTVPSQLQTLSKPKDASTAASR
ncbi:hypothetical protein [Burkholderia ubonensis]|uniref:hypothetical protein n=1 Tax=Burkholderia ubonensis TaxID=101571 RepID=UPI000A410B66|nr:hypothetical protein [Burkholderia ubonensis]